MLSSVKPSSVDFISFALTGRLSFKKAAATAHFMDTALFEKFTSHPTMPDTIFGAEITFQVIVLVMHWAFPPLLPGFCFPGHRQRLVVITVQHAAAEDDITAAKFQEIAPIHVEILEAGESIHRLESLPHWEWHA